MVKIRGIEGTLVEIDTDTNQVVISNSKGEGMIYTVDGKIDVKTLEDSLLLDVKATLYDNKLVKIAEKP